MKQEKEVGEEEQNKMYVVALEEKATGF